MIYFKEQLSCLGAWLKRQPEQCGEDCPLTVPSTVFDATAPQREQTVHGDQLHSVHPDRMVAAAKMGAKCP